MAEATMIERIRALLRKAESTQFPAEAEALRARAAILIGKHDVDERLLAGELAGVCSKLIALPKGYRKQNLRLLAYIGEALGLYVVSTWTPASMANRQAAGRQPQRDAARIYGTEDSIALVEELFRSLRTQAEREVFMLNMDDVPASVRSRSSKSGALKSYRTDFFTGWSRTVGERLADAHGAAVAAADRAGASTALVRASEHERYVEAARADFAGIDHARLTNDPESMAAGGRAGAHADIGLDRIAEGPRALSGA